MECLCVSASRTTETISETNDGGECFLIFRYFLVIFLLFTTLWEPIRALLLAANGRAGTSWQLEAWDIRCKCLKFARVVPPLYMTFDFEHGGSFGRGSEDTQARHPIVLIRRAVECCGGVEPRGGNFKVLVLLQLLGHCLGVDRRPRGFAM